MRLGTAPSTKRIELTRRSPQYWRVTLNHPPLNVFSPDSIPQLNEIVNETE
jgi:enoyl-CoA hydratase/carnithine racemase